MSYEDVEKRFNHHPPRSQERVDQHGRTRAVFRELAHQLDSDLPVGRELSLALTHLETALFWANAAIARQED